MADFYININLLKKKKKKGKMQYALFFVKV